MSRSRHAGLALKKFVVSPEGPDGVYLDVQCRGYGIRALIRSWLKLDPYVYLTVERDRIRFKELSLFREEYHTIPRRAIRAVSGGFSRPFSRLVAAVGFGTLALALLVTAAFWDWAAWMDRQLAPGDRELADYLVRNDHWLVLATLLTLLLLSGLALWSYSRDKRFFILFEYGPKPRGIVGGRTVTQHLSLADVRRAVDVVADLIAEPIYAKGMAPVAAEPLQAVDIRPEREATQTGSVGPD